jgi:hypothetical protein
LSFGEKIVVSEGEILSGGFVNDSKDNNKTDKNKQSRCTCGDNKEIHQTDREGQDGLAKDWIPLGPKCKVHPDQGKD